jgi:SAM-dependent methyltransferase
MRNRMLLVLFAAGMLGLAAPAVAQQFHPSVGQPGKDVIWVPTPEALVARMLDMAHVTPSDYVIDLGSGDGRIVIAAAKRGATAVGVEYNPDMVALSRANAEKEGVAGKATFVNGDIFETDFSKATVLTMYLLPDLNMRLRPKILEMKPGTRIVTQSFDMEDWKPDQTENVEGRAAYLWIVPAKVAGSWTWQAGTDKGQIVLLQTFQEIEGTIRLGDQELTIRDAKLEGDRISFLAGNGASDTYTFAGQVNGVAITGTRKKGNGSETQWTARRSPR